MRKSKKGLLSRILATAVLTGVLTMFVPASGFAYTQTTGTVTSSNVKVRSEASSSSTQISSLDTGDTVDIVDEATDSSGYVWYKIYVNKSTFGYVRSDLVTKSGSSSSSTSTSTSTTSTSTSTTTDTSSSTTTTTSLPATTVTSLAEQAATIIADSANVRAGAGTAYDTVGKVVKGDVVTITGEATGTDSKKWYQITFGSSNKVGFIRNDLLTIGTVAETTTTETTTTETTTTENTDTATENASVSETDVVDGSEASSEEAPAEVVEETVVNDDYSLEYSTDAEGNAVWYLYDKASDTYTPVADLEAAYQQVQNGETSSSSEGVSKVVVFILALIIAALVAIVFVLI